MICTPRGGVEGVASGSEIVLGKGSESESEVVIRVKVCMVTGLKEAGDSGGPELDSGTKSLRVDGIGKEGFFSTSI